MSFEILGSSYTVPNNLALYILFKLLNLFFIQSLSPDGSMLFICDTNQHRIKAVNTSTFTVSVINLNTNEGMSTVAAEPEPEQDVVHLDINVHPDGGSVVLKIELELRPGDKLNPEAPSDWKLMDQSNIWMTELDKSAAIKEPKFNIELHHGSLNHGQVNQTKIKLNLFLCNASNGLCSMAKKWIKVTTDVSEKSHKDVIKVVSIKV